jgi:hypothetical protein
LAELISSSRFRFALAASDGPRSLCSAAPAAPDCEDYAEKYEFATIVGGKNDRGSALPFALPRVLELATRRFIGQFRKRRKGRALL